MDVIRMLSVAGSAWNFDCAKPSLHTHYTLHTTWSITPPKPHPFCQHDIMAGWFMYKCGHGYYLHNKIWLLFPWCHTQIQPVAMVSSSVITHSTLCQQECSDPIGQFEPCVVAKYTTCTTNYTKTWFKLGGHFIVRYYRYIHCYTWLTADNLEACVC